MQPNNQPRNPQVIRGFTTLQLVELAAVAMKNQIYAEEVRRRGAIAAQNPGLSQAAVEKAAKEQVSGLTPYAGLVQVLGLPLPQLDLKGQKNFGTKVMKHLAPKPSSASGAVKAGRYRWFFDGTEKSAYRAIGNEGRAIEARRAAVYNYVVQNRGLITNAQMYPPTTAGKTVAAIAQALAQGGLVSQLSQLDEILKKSFSWGDAAKSPQSRVAAFDAVLAATVANQEPADVERAIGGGTSKAGSDDVMLKSNGTSGFLAEKVRQVLAAMTSEARATSRSTSPLSAAQQNARREVTRRLRAALQIPAGASAAVGKATALANTGGPVADAQRTAQLFQVAHGQLGDNTFWLALGKSELGQLLTGQRILAPKNVQGKSEYAYNPDAVASQNPQDAAGYTRFVFETLRAAYLQNGAQGDRLNEKAQKASNTRAQSKPRARGLQGVDQPIFKELSMENKVRVAKFVKRALANGYTLEALRLGVTKLGMEGRINVMVVLPSTLAQNIADLVLTAYGPAIANEAVPDAGALEAGCAALRITGFSKLKSSDIARCGAARQAIREAYDAAYGVLTGDCTKKGRGKQIKQIAHALGVTIPQGANAQAACQAISAAASKQGIPSEAPSQQLSSGRRQHPVAYEARAKASKSKAASGESAVLMSVLGAGAGAAARVGSGNTQLPPAANYFPGNTQPLIQPQQPLFQPAVTQQPIGLTTSALARQQAAQAAAQAQQNTVSQQTGQVNGLPGFQF